MSAFLGVRVYLEDRENHGFITRSCYLHLQGFGRRIAGARECGEECERQAGAREWSASVDVCLQVGSQVLKHRHMPGP